jgi:hypothetical protein
MVVGLDSTNERDAAGTCVPVAAFESGRFVVVAAGDGRAGQTGYAVDA